MQAIVKICLIIFNTYAFLSKISVFLLNDDDFFINGDKELLSCVLLNIIPSEGSVDREKVKISELLNSVFLLLFVKESLNFISVLAIVFYAANLYFTVP